MNLYISDLHFGHKNVILFEHRPFSDVDTMDHCLIQLWNSRVSADDDVYIVGDFCYLSGRTPDWYLRRFCRSILGMIPLESMYLLMLCIAG